MKRLFQRLKPSGLQSRQAYPVVCLRRWGQPPKVAQRSMWSMVVSDREKQLLWRLWCGVGSHHESPIPASGARWAAVAKSVACGASEVVRPAVNSLPTQHAERVGLQSRHPAPVARLRGWGKLANMAYSSVWSQMVCSGKKCCLWRVWRGRASSQKSLNAACRVW